MPWRDSSVKDRMTQCIVNFFRIKNGKLVSPENHLTIPLSTIFIQYVYQYTICLYIYLVDIYPICVCINVYLKCSFDQIEGHCYVSLPFQPLDRFEIPPGKASSFEESDGTGIGRNEIRVVVGRGDLGNRLVCKADNEALTDAQPLSTHVRMEVNCK